jgi:hypothetical protein
VTSGRPFQILALDGAGYRGLFSATVLAAFEEDLGRAEHVGADPKGLVLSIPRSKTDPYAAGQLVVLPYSSRPGHCPVAALQRWLKVVLRRIHRNGTTVMPLRTRRGRNGLETLPGLSEAAVNAAVQRACVRALGVEKGMTYSAHSLRAGFATYASQRGAPDRAIAHQTRHRSLSSLDQYIRMESVWADNAATALGL